MTRDELRAAAVRLKTIEDAQEQLAAAKNRLVKFNDMKAKGKFPDPQGWTVSVRIDAGYDQYGNGAEDIRVFLPAEIAQQQLVYAVMRAERYLLRVGG